MSFQLTSAPSAPNTFLSFNVDNVLLRSSSFIQLIITLFAVLPSLSNDTSDSSIV